MADYFGIISSFQSTVMNAVSGLPNQVISSFFSYLTSLLTSFVQPLFDVMKVLLTVNIDAFSFQSVWLMIVAVISCFYLILFLIVGLKFLLGSYDAVQRSEAKEWFKGAILVVIGVNASLLLYSLLLSLSSAIGLTLWNGTLESLFSPSGLSGFDFLWLTVLAISVFFALITLLLRQVFLIVSVMLFPIGIFLYFIPPIKQYGKAVLELVGIAAFMNVLDIIILIGVKLFQDQFNPLISVGLLSLSSGFLLIGVANVIIAGFAVNKALSSAGVNVNFVEIGKNLIGPALMAL